jgi:uncharacterized phiE125 gp8 family phage protein
MAISYLDNMFNKGNYEYLNPSQNKYGNLELKTYPTTQVVTTAELKSQLRIDSTTEDTLLDTYISAATQMAEHYCNRHFINARYDLNFLKELPSKFSLYYPDVTLDTSHSTTEDDGLFTRANGISSPLTQEASTEYYIDRYSSPCYVVLNESVSTATDEFKSTYVGNYLFRFTTGMGTAASDVPDAIKQAIKLIAGDMYYFREDRKRAFPMASEILLQPYKCYL